MRRDRVWSISLDVIGDFHLQRRRGVAHDPRHGTENLYQRACRCPRCKTAHAAYRAARRLAGLEGTA